MSEMLLASWTPQIGSNSDESDSYLLTETVDEVAYKLRKVWFFLEIFQQLIGLGKFCGEFVSLQEREECSFGGEAEGIWNVGLDWGEGLLFGRCKERFFTVLQNDL